MQSAYAPESWQNFYVMTGGAAAALTGLLFVAMSVHARSILRNPIHSGRAVGTLVSLLGQLLLSGAILVPNQPLSAIGIEVEAAAIFFLIISIRAVIRGTAHRRAVAAGRRRAIELAGALVWIVLFMATGVSLITRVGGGFYLLAVVMGFMFCWNVYIAWSLIADIAE